MKMNSFKQFFEEKQVLGLIEFFDLDGVGKVPAKLDSGNGSFNVLHGEEIQIQGDKVFFRTVNNKTLLKPLKTTVTINVGAGNVEERPVVEFDVVIGGKLFKKTPFSIGNRLTNIYKILVGKDFIENNLDALIDVGQENIADEDISVEI
jgi:hypothetical protein